MGGWYSSLASRAGSCRKISLPLHRHSPYSSRFCYTCSTPFYVTHHCSILFPAKRCVRVYVYATAWFHMASHARYKEFGSVKWTVRGSSLKLCTRFLVCGRQSLSVTSAFLTKGYGTPLVDVVCEILHAPKRFFGDVSLYAVTIGPHFFCKRYSSSSIFTAVERIPRSKQGGVAA